MASLRWVPTCFLFAAVAVVPLLSTGCAEHRRVYYDQYHHDRHGWSEENPHYMQWEHDTHTHHRNFDKRSDAEKKEYWDWRHSHQ
jgi:hypothetical protein